MRLTSSDDIVQERLRAQHLRTSGLRPESAVESLGAIQAQDYRGGLWGVGLRAASTTEGEVERALAERAILRTWPMRGTLHFVASADVRWMLRLLTPRVLVRCEGRSRALGLDAATLRKSRARLEAALVGDRALTRAEVYAVLEGAGVATAGGRGLHVLLLLGIQGVLCFGTRRGRQPTFVLLDEWVPRSRALERDAALGELAARYFTSHGPATVHDFSWWSGLTVGDARRAIEIAGSALAKRGIGARDYWSGGSLDAPSRRPSVAHLLPPWDELTVAYRDRDAFLDPAHAERTRNGIFAAVVAIDGRIAGLWQRRETRDQVQVEAELFAHHPPASHIALERAAARYATFLGVRGSLVLTKLQPSPGGESVAGE
jgi:hypothetical protein